VNSAILTDYCTECSCNDPDFTDYCQYECENVYYEGDGFCDDQNNHCGCDWDGGDCCGAQTQYAYCTTCECLDPVFRDLECNMGCFKDAWTGDGYCDDGNNNCGCDWDSGDCCGTGQNYNYCTDCACLEPGWFENNPPSGRCSGACQKPAWQGDGFCDDGNNVCGCDWDNGDCCDLGAHYSYCVECLCIDVSFVANQCESSCRYEDWVGDSYCDDGNNNMNYCDDCECLDPDVVGGDCLGACKYDAWFADGICDSVNNNCGCDWDGGDCCNPSSKFDYCAGDTACDCLDPAADTGCNVGCRYESYQGDGYCDDENNICGCDWDGGDCCEGLLTYCTECQCRDPDIGECYSICGVDAWFGDFVCDDENNNCGCDWDGGDCCGKTDAYDYTQCDECVCKQPEGCVSVCETPAWTADGYCDDGNNNCGCGWDDGDCCDFGNANFNYCSICTCLDPDDTTNFGQNGSS